MKNINIKQISPDPEQPRKFFDASKLAKLRKSIEKYGIINPLVVEEIGKDKYLLVDGERRFKAASEVGLKEVPVNIIPSQDKLDRLIRQFHIQEQQEGWSPIEKASVLDQLSNEMGIGISKACELLGIEKRTAVAYVSFSKLADKDLFVRSEIPMQLAHYMVSVRTLAKKLSAEVLEKKFITSDDKLLEKAMINRILEGQLERPTDFSKIKDTFTKDPKMIEKFMTDKDLSVVKMFDQSRAKSTFHLRNVYIGLGHVEGHLNKYFENPNIKPDERLIGTAKRVHKKLEELLKKIG